MGRIFIGAKVIDSSDLPDDLAAPNWNDETNRVHNWRNHIGWFAQENWAIFSRYQKIILWLDAEEAASSEEWE
jgi:hypothetical protein